MLVVNSPLNPTGTVLDEQTLTDICDLILEENERRGHHERPLYLLYDQVYWMLTFNDIASRHARRAAPGDDALHDLGGRDIEGIRLDGASGGLAAGADRHLRSMGDFIGHIGAWAPRPEQVATAGLLVARPAIEQYNRVIRQGLQLRLDALYGGITAMRDRGLPVDAVPPAGAIYLSARFALAGCRTPGGDTLHGNEEIRRYLLQEAGFAAVPFQAFGVEGDTGWFRLSAGAVSPNDIAEVLPRVAAAIDAVGVPSGR